MECVYFCYCINLNYGNKMFVIKNDKIFENSILFVDKDDRSLNNIM